MNDRRSSLLVALMPTVAMAFFLVDAKFDDGLLATLPPDVTENLMDHA